MLNHTSHEEKIHRWTSKLQPVEAILTKVENTNYHNSITEKFWTECWNDDPRYLFVCAKDDNTGSWERIRPADVLDDFRDFFEMSSILDVLYWFDAHKKDTGTRNILRAPCRADNITVYGKNHNLMSTLEAIKRMTQSLEHVNAYNTKYRAGRETLEHAESNAYRNAFSHIDSYLKTSGNRIFRHRDISPVLELARGYLHEEYMLSRRRLLALTNRMILLEEHLSYELHYHVHYNAITCEDIIKRFFGRDEELQNKIENCEMIMNAIIAERAIR